jgi:hypothetical protein
MELSGLRPGMAGSVAVASEWGELRDELGRRGVARADDLGRFVSDPRYVRPSRLDERAAMPVLIEALPALSDATLVAAVAGHLRRPWARPAAFPALRAAFERWALADQMAGWHLGDAMASAAVPENSPDLLRIAADRRYGTARQMVVYQLWRFRRSAHVEGVLGQLLDDPDVAMHAMTALRRVVGPEAVLPRLRQLQAAHGDDPIGRAARREIRKAESAVGRLGQQGTPRPT